ncbi:MAG: OsmC family peroxiredoxin, partial [Prevotellaceae bacterium]|nr:OsmC family peroxiredoxin [Prevotellaceae bacterium]
MQTLSTIYQGNLSTEITHLQSGSVIVTDAPTDNHGKGKHFGPTDLFAASFGSCMLTIMGIAAQTHNFNIDGATLKTTKIMAQNPRRIGEIIVEITFPH